MHAIIISVHTMLFLSLWHSSYVSSMHNVSPFLFMHARTLWQHDATTTKKNIAKEKKHAKTLSIVDDEHFELQIASTTNLSKTHKQLKRITHAHGF